MATYKVKPGCKGCVPYWTSDLIGIANYDKLNKGAEVNLGSLNSQLIEFVDEVSNVAPTSSNTNAEIRAYLDSIGVDYGSRDSKDDLLAKIPG